MKQQLFPIFDPITEECIGFKKRELVHFDGDWHKGIQANIIRVNQFNTFDILIQQRSSFVDIGKHNYDQSLATQMLKEDNLDEEKTLKRGLYEELGITTYKKTKLNYPMRIIKKYNEDVTKLNRELITLFIVLIDQKQTIAKKCKKINELYWMEWNDFLYFYSARKKSFTKTVQFYFDTPDTLHAMTYQSMTLIKPKIAPQTRHNLSLLHIYFSDTVKNTFSHNDYEIGKFSNFLKAPKEKLFTYFQLNLH